MNKKGLIVMIVIAIFLGIFMTRQFLLSEKIKKEVKLESNQALAYEVSELFKSNEELKQEIDKLEEEVNKLQKTYLDSKQASDTLDDKTKNYKIILGAVSVKGPGIKIEFDKKISSVQIIDLLNALKNIGAEAIMINDKRIVTNSSIISGLFSPPVKIEVIGNKELLHSSLTRPGGMMDQIGYGQITVVDDIILPKI